MSDVTAPEKTARGRIVNISESGVCAEVAMHLAEGAIAKLQIEHCTLFGHVIYCRPEGPVHRIGMEVVRVLIGESDLSRLMKKVHTEAVQETPEMTRPD